MVIKEHPAKHEFSILCRRDPDTNVIVLRFWHPDKEVGLSLTIDPGI
jgi:hypothetical protein